MAVVVPPLAIAWSEGPGGAESLPVHGGERLAEGLQSRRHRHHRGLHYLALEWRGLQRRLTSRGRNVRDNFSAREHSGLDTAGWNQIGEPNTS
jgi:hypothetical protein